MTTKMVELSTTVAQVAATTSGGGEDTPIWLIVVIVAVVLIAISVPLTMYCVMCGPLGRRIVLRYYTFHDDELPLDLKSLPVLRMETTTQSEEWNCTIYDYEHKIAKDNIMEFRREVFGQVQHLAEIR